MADLVHRGILEAAGTQARAGQLLWNVRSKDNKEIWRPKSEVSFGAWLADQLSVRLERTGIVINREVRVRETTTQHGQAVDIQADAPVIEGLQDDPARCRIELKGNWHTELMTAMRTQLADDAELASQAETLRELGLDVRSTVIYVPRPVSSARRGP
jgi:hypothetical protein